VRVRLAESSMPSRVWKLVRSVVAPQDLSDVGGLGARDRGSRTHRNEVNVSQLDAEVLRGAEPSTATDRVS